MSDKLSKKFSIDVLLDNIGSDPDSIDEMLIGSVVANTKKSARAKNVSGLEQFNELNDFITRESRVPLTGSSDWSERKLAHRLQGYARNPREYQDLIPFDTHSVIGTRSLINSYFDPKQLDLEPLEEPITKPVTKSIEETRQPVIEDLFSVGHFDDDPDFYLRESHAAKNNPSTPPDTIFIDPDSTPMSSQEAMDHPMSAGIEDIVAAENAIAAQKATDIQDSIDAFNVAYSADELGLTPDEVIASSDTNNTSNDLVDDLPAAYDNETPSNSELLADDPFAEAVFIEVAEIFEPQDDIEEEGVATDLPATHLEPSPFCVIAPLCSTAIKPNLDILYRYTPLCVVTKAPSLNVLYRQSSVVAPSNEAITKAVDAKETDTKAADKPRNNPSQSTHTNTNPLATNTQSKPAILPVAADIDADTATHVDNPANSVDDIYEAIHISDDRYQAFIDQPLKNYSRRPKMPDMPSTPNNPTNPATGNTINRSSVSKPSVAPSPAKYHEPIVKPDVEAASDFSLSQPLDDATNYDAATTDDDAPASIDDILDADFDFINDMAVEENEWFADAYQVSAVKSPKDIAKPDEVGRQTRCDDFYVYEPRFKVLHEGLKSRRLKTIKHTAVNFKEGDAFILNGMLGFIQSKGKLRIGSDGSHDPRLRLIFENGTESNILLSTLNKNLYMDDTGRRVIQDSQDFNDFNPHVRRDRVRTGQLYIVRSLSTNPKIRDIRDLYKIGFTTRTIEERAYNSRNDIAFLESTVEVVATAECYDLDPQGLEFIMHNFLHAQRLLITLTSKNGQTYHPKEWFCVDINDAKLIIQLIVDGQLTNYRMDNTTGRLVSK